MKAKAFSRRVVGYGPGGYKCPCCGPNPKCRREARQHERRVFDRLFDTIDRQEHSVAHIDVGFLVEFDYDWYYNRADSDLSLHEEWLVYQENRDAGATA